MKIVSWNVNGIRAVHRKGDFWWIPTYGADIYCLQETKASPDQLVPAITEIDGYASSFAFSRVRKGYSGTAIYTRPVPDHVSVGFGIEKFDEQGRVLTHTYGNLSIVNSYMPNGASATASLPYKLEFYDEFLAYINTLRQDGQSVIACGDFNVAHAEIDLARPEANKNSIGFLPEERAWIDELEANGYTDIFRALHPRQTGAYTYWDLKSGARERNVGWRLDYFFITKDLVPRVQKAEILSDVFGSDHCPILLELK